MITIYKIHFKKTKYYPYEYQIISGTKIIGTIKFMIKKNLFLLGNLLIYPEYQKQYYGYKIIEYIFSHYKIKCIIGETLIDSRGFWNKCIKKYNGQRKNIAYSDDCSSSFIIPKYNLTRMQVYEYLHDLYKTVM